MARKRKFPGCSECKHLARHPKCPLCPKKCHWIGGLVKQENGQEEIDRSAPSRRLDHRVSIAYLLPFMAQQGQLPEAELPRVTKQVLGDVAQKVVDSQVYGFQWGKHPYKFKVIEADLQEGSAPFVRIRYAGWSCKDHKGATPADLPGLVLERDSYRCVVCGATSELSVAYLVRPEEKGRASLGNMATFCASCVKERGEEDYWSFLRRRGVPIRKLVINFRTGYVRSVISGDRIYV